MECAAERLPWCTGLCACPGCPDAARPVAAAATGCPTLAATRLVLPAAGLLHPPSQTATGRRRSAPGQLLWRRCRAGQGSSRSNGSAALQRAGQRKWRSMGAGARAACASCASPHAWRHHSQGCHPCSAAALPLEALTQSLLGSGLCTPHHCSRVGVAFSQQPARRGSRAPGSIARMRCWPAFGGLRTRRLPCL